MPEPVVTKPEDLVSRVSSYMSKGTEKPNEPSGDGKEQPKVVDETTFD